MLSDFRLSLRSLSKNRSFAVVAILTLAVGIGASSTMFGTLRALVLSPFDYPQADRIAMVWSGNGWPLSPADFFDLKEQSTSFTDFGVYSPGSFNVGRENAQSLAGANVTYGVLRAFGVAPARGRLFEESDDVKGAPPVAIISHSLWQQSFGGDPNLVGNTVRINSTDVTLVGIMPEGFEFVGPWIRTVDPQVWMPQSLEEQKATRDSHWLCGVARLKPGVSVEAAHAEVQAIGKRLTELYPNSNTRKEMLVRSLHTEMTREGGTQVWVLFGAVILVLLVACANVASMLLARGTRRAGEFAVRVALGATRGAMVRLALAESLLLAGAGAVAGMVLGVGGIAIMQAIAPVSAARKAAITLDGPVLLFALGATLLTALLAGLPPALAAMRTSLAGVMRSDARGAVGSRSRNRMLRTLLIGQVAVAFILANGAALFSAGYLQLLEENAFLATDHALTAQINLRGDTYKEDTDRVAFWNRLVERLETLPGVTSVGITSKLPLEGGSNTNVLVNDQVYDPSQRRTSVERSSVTGGYFDALGIKLVKGRNLRPEDRAPEGEVRGVVVNRAMVAAAWPDKEPLGELMRSNSPDKPNFVGRVVGVVEDVRQWGAAQPARPEMYLTPENHWGRSIHVVIRSAQPAAALAPQLRKELAALDSELALEDIRTLRQVVGDATASQRAVTGLVNFFMAAALGLVAVGLYGTLSYTVQQRTREIGVRMAVGALHRDILRLIFTQGGRWVAIGIVVGLIGTFASASVLKTLVYQMKGVTAPPLMLASAAVGIAAALACWLPARRAAKMDPLAALRSD
ncbi:MAG TPA: ABC transporter permease [Opitutaceae bacterium]